MKRHPFNVFSLVLGVVLILLAAWAVWIGFPVRGWFFDTRHWLFPAAVILVGVALVSPLFATMHSNRTSGDETEGDASGPASDTTPDHP